MQPPNTLEADYVIVGAGAIGLAFADTLLTETAATIILVDRRASPGGHWNDAYPFVTLHGPAMTYGVESMPLDAGHIDEDGLNRGLHELVGGARIRTYYDRVLRDRLLPSGRVRYLPLHDCAYGPGSTDRPGDAGGHAAPPAPGGSATSLVSGQRVRLLARRRWVDCTRADTQVPATHGPGFAVADGVTVVTPSELAAPWRDPATDHGHVIVGGGKTAMDTALWLLQQGVEPDTITWIRPREAWLLNRANVQPTAAFAERTLLATLGELETVLEASSAEDLFARLEARGLLLRIDRGVRPTMYRCAIVSELELAELRRIRKVVRLGHVHRIERDRIVLDGGAILTSPRHVHVHCTSAGLPRAAAQPVFQQGLVVPQYVRRCSPCFSAAFVAHVEATVDGDDDAKNALCGPVRVPEEPLDWLRMHLQTARNQLRWGRDPDLQAWLLNSRMEAFTQAFATAARQPTPAWITAQQRLRDVRAGALTRMQVLLEEALEERRAHAA